MVAMVVAYVGWIWCDAEELCAFAWLVQWSVERSIQLLTLYFTQYDLGRISKQRILRCEINPDNWH